ncbi:T9SS type A sorting domain-containing protein [bacterium]|nr:T9SS type A sorting domain-containing protein [bacterium]
MHFKHMFSALVVFGMLFSSFINAQYEGKYALFVVADETALNNAENELTWRLEDMGFDLTVWGQAASSDEITDGMDLVLVSATVSSGTIADNMPGLPDLPVPVINWEPFLYDALGFQAADGGEFSAMDIEIIADGHPLAAGLATGVVTVATVEKGISYGTPEGDAEIIAVNTLDPTQAVLFGYDAGDLMAAGPAPARRIGHFLLNDVADAMTEEGWALFDASVNWAMGSEGSDVESQTDALPSEFALDNNYPNPFNPVTSIPFSVPRRSRIRISVLNSLGQEVAIIADDIRNAGRYTVDFDASEISSGLYFYQLCNGSQILTRKMLVLR